MLTFLPQTPAGSILFSRYIYYHCLSGNASILDSKIQLFGTKNATANDIFGTSIKHLSTQLPVGSISDEHLRNHSTLFGLYSSTVSSEVREAWRRRLTARITRSINTFTGGRSPLAKRYLHFCKQCVLDDIENYGFAFWRLIHQVPGVAHCLDHKTELYGCCSACNKPIASRDVWNPPSLSCPSCRSATFKATIIPKCPAYSVFVDLCDAALKGLTTGLAPEERKHRYEHLGPTDNNTPPTQRLDFFIQKLLDGWQCDTLEDLSLVLGVDVNQKLIDRAIKGTDTAASPFIHLALIAALPSPHSEREINFAPTESPPRLEILSAPMLSTLETHSINPSVALEKINKAASQLGLPIDIAVELFEGATERRLKEKYGIAIHRVTALRVDLNDMLTKNSIPTVNLSQFIIKTRHLQKLSENRIEILNAAQQDVDFEKLRQIFPDTIKWCERHDRAWLSELRLKLYKVKNRETISTLINKGYYTHRMLWFADYRAYNWARKYDREWLNSLFVNSEQRSTERLTENKCHRAIKQAIVSGEKNLPERELTWVRKHDHDWLLHMVPHMKMRALLAREDALTETSTVEQLTAASRDIISYAVAHGVKQRSRLPVIAKDWAVEHDKEWIDMILPPRTRQAYLENLSWEDMRDDCRKRILMAMSKGHTNRQSLPISAFRWCLRNDKQWLDENVPKRRLEKGDHYFDRMNDRPFAEVQALCRQAVLKAIDAGVHDRGHLPTRAKAWLHKHDFEWLDNLLPRKHPGIHKKASRSIFKKPFEETRGYCRNSIMTSISKGVHMRSKLPRRCKDWCYKNDREWFEEICAQNLKH